MKQKFKLFFRTSLYMAYSKIINSNIYLGFRCKCNINAIVILIAYSFCTIHAQSQNIKYEITDSLLTGKYTQKVVWDSKDTMWLKISYGLYKYYGDSLYHFTTENSDIPTDKIRRIAVDSNDTIWILTDIGLIKYDHSNFTTYDSTIIDIPSDYSYFDMAIDKDNNIWFSASSLKEGGLIKYDKKEWIKYTPDNSLLPESTVISIVFDSKNNIWLACAGNSSKYSRNVIKISGDEWSIYNEGNTGIPLYNFLTECLTLDCDDNLFLHIDYSISSGNNTGKPSTIKYDGSNWSVIEYLDSECISMVGTYCGGLDNIIWRQNGYLIFYGEDSDSVLVEFNHLIYDIVTRNDGNIWICTTNGIYILEAKSTNIIDQQYKPNEINIYPNPTTQFVAIDCEQFDHCDIYNIMGAFISSSKSKIIDFSNYINGIYMLIVIDKKGYSTIKKVLLNKD